MNIRRKMNRKGAIKPPLSFVDKLIYCILLLFGFSFVFLTLLYVSVAESIGHADTDVIASSNLAAALWALPLSLGLPMSISMPWVTRCR